MVKLYIKRNINQLADVTFGNDNYTLPIDQTSSFLHYLKLIYADLVVISADMQLVDYFTHNNKLYVGEFKNNSLNGYIESLKKRQWYDDFWNHLELIEE